MEKANKKDVRSKTWNVIVYPESAPEDWKEQLVEQGVFFVCSPLHDKDTLPTGEIKKAHWHVLLCFTSNKTYTQVLEITKTINALTPQKSNSTGGSIRYMIHIDSPDKFQYSKLDIEVYGNIDIEQYFRITSGERYELIKEMIIFVKEHEIKEIQDLIDYAMECRFDDWFPLLCDNSTFIMSHYIKSVRHRSE